MNLSGKTVLLTGASKGIGAATAKILTTAGARLIVHARNERDAGEAAEPLAALPVWGDLSTSDGIDQVARLAGGVTPSLDVLICNAGVISRGGLEQVDRAELERVLAVNTIAPILLTQALLPQLRAAAPSQVIVVSSTMGQFSEGMGGGSLAYRLSKSAVNAFVLNSASELAADGIRVNAVHPGWVRTSMTNGSGKREPDEPATEIAQLAASGPEGPNGAFLRFGEQIAW